MLLVNWFNIEYLEIPAKGDKYGFFILAGYWVYHPWILCAYDNQAGDEKAYGKKSALVHRRDRALGGSERLACSLAVWKTLR